MLDTSVGILSPASIGGGQYTFDLFFQDGTSAKYLRVGDHVEANNGDRYSVDTWSGSPSDFSSGSSVTATFVDNDSLPPADTGFNSLVRTPGQADLTPALQTGGTIGAISTFSGQDFEYTLSAAWNDNVEANNAQLGDRIIDGNGKEFEISFLDAGLFNDPFRVIESEPTGQPPVAGDAGLYRGTLNFEFYQGPALTDPARTNIFNRDAVIIDANLGSGGSANGDWTKVSHVISAGEETAKTFAIVPTPLDSTEVLAHIVTAPAQRESTDYSISGASFSWAALALDGILAENDVVELYYFS